MARRLAVIGAITIALSGVAAPALACGGLIGRNGAVNLLRATTLAAYHRGVEHYVTSFSFAGAGAENFGSLVPLPGIPSKVERGGDWTLQRLIRETSPALQQAAAESLASDAGTGRARVLLETTIDALDITILEGGARAIAQWAADNEFELPPDAPEVLEFYARRSPIFMAARFDVDAAVARDQRAGEGTPIHLTIPTTNPWVPLRILALGKQSVEQVQADVYLLTDREPALLPKPLDAEGEFVAGPGLRLVRSERASESLMNDLRADKGMGWMPPSMWLTFLQLDAPASDVVYDLAVDASGAGAPSPTAAGLASAVRDASGDLSWILLAGAAAAAAIAVRTRRSAPSVG